MASTTVRVGTWNLEGRWDIRCEAALARVSADVWLLTGLPDSATPAGFRVYPSASPLRAGRHWSAVLVREGARSVARWDEDLHPASSAVVVGRLVYCSSVLPWHDWGLDHPWEGATAAEKTASVTQRLSGSLPRGATVWGGDWNHAFDGPERTGTLEGREHIRDAVDKLDLTVATADLPHRLPGLRTIDHVAVPRAARVKAVRRVEMKSARRHLTDHDAHVVDVRFGATRRSRTTPT